MNVKRQNDGPEGESLIPRHGGFRNLKSFRIAELIYDVTQLFCDKFIERSSRTHDQMVQAARSGRQNIAEGSVDSGTSKKIEMKLTGIAAGSLEELRLDYEDFLRKRDLPQWPPDHPALKRFKALRCDSLQKFREWVAREVRREERATAGAKKNADGHRRTRTYGDGCGQARADSTTAREPRGRKNQARQRTERNENDADTGRVGPCQSVSVRVPLDALPAVLAANGALSILNLCISLLRRQIEAQAEAFEKEDGFTERLYRTRQRKRRKS